MPNLVMSSKEIASLAALPSRDELLSQIVGYNAGADCNFVRTLNEVPTAFVRGSRGGSRSESKLLDLILATIIHN